MAFSKMGFGVGKSRAFDFEKAMGRVSKAGDNSDHMCYNLAVLPKGSFNDHSRRKTEIE
jgi:hypothetical protein